MYAIRSYYGFTGILLVLTLKLYPFVYLYVSGALKSIDVSLSEAAESLGCDPIKKVFTIILPLVTPTVLAGGLLVFMNALADFGTRITSYNVCYTKLLRESEWHARRLATPRR